MKHESIVVVYDSCQAIAEEIADKLGAETVSVQSMNVRQIENSQSLVLAVEFQDGGNLSLPSAISTIGFAPFRQTYKTIRLCSTSLS